jgi:hypothetical protein
MRRGEIQQRVAVLVEGRRHQKRRTVRRDTGHPEIFVVGELMLGIATTLGAGTEGRHSSVLKQPEDVAIGVGDGGHQAAATDVAHGLLHGGTGSGHLG